MKKKWKAFLARQLEARKSHSGESSRKSSVSSADSSKSDKSKAPSLLLSFPFHFRAFVLCFHLVFRFVVVGEDVRGTCFLNQT